VDSPARRFSARQAEFDSISAFIDSQCTCLAQDERLRIILLVEELFANTVNHGYGGDSDKPVWISVRAGEDLCRVVYEDSGPAYDPFAAVDSSSTEADLEQRRIGGLGIVLLMELSSGRTYERRGDRNVIQLDIPRARPDQHSESRPEFG
jgi:anti-sigma regulatory factor (Ser/Thr protein kinase)